MRIARRHLFAGALAAVVVAGAAALLRPAAVPAEAGRVERGTLEVTVEGTGRTRVRERYVVAAPVTGDLVRLDLHAGDAVAEGQRVATILPSELDPRTRTALRARADAAVAAVAEARAALARARAAEDEAVRERDRVRALATASALPPRERDAAETIAVARAEETRMAGAAVRRLEREADAARAAVADAAARGDAWIAGVRAPASGRVLRVLRESGGPVEAGTPLVELGDPARLEVVVDLLTADAVRVRAGDRARVSAWGGDAPLAAVVRHVEPSAFTKVSPLGVEEQRVNAVLDPAGGGWEALGDGFSVEVAIVIDRRPDVLKAPASALFRTGGGWAVFAIEDGVARRRPVVVAARADREAAIAEGLREGDRVVLHPGDRIEDGRRVEAR